MADIDRDGDLSKSKVLGRGREYVVLSGIWFSSSDRPLECSVSAMKAIFKPTLLSSARVQAFVFGSLIPIEYQVRLAKTPPC